MFLQLLSHFQRVSVIFQTNYLYAELIALSWFTVMLLLLVKPRSLLLRRPIGISLCSQVEAVAINLFQFQSHALPFRPTLISYSLLGCSISCYTLPHSLPGSTITSAPASCLMPHTLCVCVAAIACHSRIFCALEKFLFCLCLLRGNNSSSSSNKKLKEF